MRSAAVFAALIGLAALAAAQTQAPATSASGAPSAPAARPASASQAAPPTVSRDSEHYRLTSDVSAELIVTTLAKLEAAYSLFADLFHFVPDAMLKVTLFNDKSRFDDYLQTVIKETRDDFVYIHYADAAKSELVAFEVADERRFDASLLHQACIQFLKSRVPNPPVWLQEGTAAYLERSTYSADTHRFQFKPNLAWLQPLKARLGSEQEIPVSRLIMLDGAAARAQIDAFYPEAWALVSFLLDSDSPDINRLYWDSLTALDAALSVADNSARVRDRAFRWYDEEKLEKRYLDYARGLRGFNDLVAEGTELYSRKQYDQANDAFVAAMRVEPDNFVPYYYLGLINYATADYRSAEVLFKSALDLGADAALTQYALGVNAFAGNELDQSRAYLLAAKKANPAGYGDKVDSLLARISTLR